MCVCVCIYPPFFKDFFLYGPFLKPLIESVTILFLFYVLLFWPRGVWDLGSLTGDQTRNPCIGRRSLSPTGPSGSPRPLLLDFLPIEVATDH